MGLTGGIGIDDAIINAWTECVKDKKRKYLLLKLDKKNEHLLIDCEDDPAEAEEGKFDEFIEKFPSDECRYGLYKLNITVEGGYGTSPRNKNIMISWAPENAKIKNKMVHASTKETLKEKLEGTGSSVGCGIDKVIACDSEAELQSDNLIEELSSMANIKSSGTIIAFEGKDIE